jgi:hypothetical protein
MWFGEVDDFGIRVIARGGGGVQPFRIGVVSKAKFEEARRMASMAASASDEALASTMQNVVSGEQIDAPGSNLDTGDDDESTRVWRSIDSENGENLAVLRTADAVRSSDRWTVWKPALRMSIRRWIRISSNTLTKCCVKAI